MEEERKDEMQDQMHSEDGKLKPSTWKPSHEIDEKHSRPITFPSTSRENSVDRFKSFADENTSAFYVLCEQLRKPVEDELARSKKQFQKLNQKYKQVVQKLTDTEEKYEREKAQRNKTEADLSGLRKDTREHLEGYDEKFNLMTSKFEAEIASVKAAIEKKLNAIQLETSREITDWRSSFKDVFTKCGLPEEHENLTVQLESANNQKRQLSAQLKDLEKAVAVLNVELKERNLEILKSKKNEEEFKKKIHAFESNEIWKFTLQKQKEFQDQVETQRKEIEALNAKSKELSKQLSQKEDFIQHTKAETKSLREDKAKLESIVKDMQNTLETNRIAQDGLSHENSKLQNLLQKNNAAMTSLEAKIACLQSENTLIQDDMTEKRNALKNLKENNVRLKDDLQKSDSRGKELEAKLEKMMKKKEKKQKKKKQKAAESAV